MQVAKNVEFPTADWEDPEKLIDVNMVSVYSILFYSILFLSPHTLRGPLARYSHHQLCLGADAI